MKGLFLCFKTVILWLLNLNAKADELNFTIYCVHFDQLP